MFTIQSFENNPFRENTYILFNENKQAIITDPGAYTEEEKASITDFIVKNDLEIQYLLNTHCHIDHVFSEKYISDKYKLTPYLHREEEELLTAAKIQSDKFGFDFEAYSGDFHFIDENDEIDLGEDHLKILFVPGHSPGSIAFYCEAQNFVIGGDVLFRGSIGRTDLYKGNHEQLLHSIKEKLFTLPDDTVVYPGHGPSTTVGYEKLHNPFL